MQALPALFHYRRSLARRVQRMKAVFLDYATVSFRGDLDPSPLARALPGVEIRDHTRQQDVAATIAGREVVMLNKLRLTREIIESTPTLRLVALTATGTNNVDLEAARERGIAVCNLRDYCTASVVQHVYATLLALTQRLREYDRLVRSGAWQRGEQFCLLDYPIRELTGRTLGIVGYGALGRGVAHAAAAFGMQVVIANRPGGDRVPGRVDLADLLSRASPSRNVGAVRAGPPPDRRRRSRATSGPGVYGDADSAALLAGGIRRALHPESCTRCFVRSPSCAPARSAAPRELDAPLARGWACQ